MHSFFKGIQPRTQWGSCLTLKKCDFVCLTNQLVNIEQPNLKHSTLMKIEVKTNVFITSRSEERFEERKTYSSKKNGSLKFSPERNEQTHMGIDCLLCASFPPGFTFPLRLCLSALQPQWAQPPSDQRLYHQAGTLGQPRTNTLGCGAANMPSRFIYHQPVHSRVINPDEADAWQSAALTCRWMRPCTVCTPHNNLRWSNIHPSPSPQRILAFKQFRSRQMWRESWLFFHVCFL